jgi:HSP20 family molecular chaperone IbpA
MIRKVFWTEDRFRAYELCGPLSDAMKALSEAGAKATVVNGVMHVSLDGVSIATVNDFGLLSGAKEVVEHGLV